MTITSVTYQCEACEAKPDFAGLDPFKEHLQTVHDLNPEGLKGKKELLLHMSAGRQHISQYRWALECGLTFIQVQVCEKGRRRS